LQVDRGAIKFILQGADIMAPGLTSAGGIMPDDINSGQVVVIHAEGKEHALAVGRMMLSSAEIKSSNTGHAITNLHCLCDGLWKIDRIKQ
jgi:malignant T-cell-amplified sequence